jgi:glycine hydroxymethyltransferase
MVESVIGELVARHEKMRSEGLNLIPSENWLSPAVRAALATDLAGRYHSSWYGGTEHIRRIIEETEKAARRLFRARFAMATPLSGLTCDLTVLHTFTRPQDKVAIPPFTQGGFPFGIGKFHRQRVFFPVDEATYVPDAEKAKGVLSAEKPALAFLGSSFIFFRHPVKAVADHVRAGNLPTRVVFDGAHVLGLIATGEFQDPLREGAEVLFGSTHKSLYGPQGGLILTNSKELDGQMRSFLDVDVESGIGLVDNPHMNRMAALGLALEELERDRGYGTQVIKNAKALARSLEDEGVPVRFAERGYTESHQLLLNIKEARAVELCHRMEKAGIFCDEGGRLGTGEVTHRGMREDDMAEVGALFAEVYKRGARDATRKAVYKLARKFAH